MHKNQSKTRQPRGWKSVLTAVLFCAVAAQAQTFTPLADFSSSTGGGPGSPPIQGLDGKLYGTAGSSGPKQRGTLYSATTGGTLSDFLTFCKTPSCPTGAGPYLSLLQTSDGSLFGFTLGTSFNGTIFKLTPAGAANNLYTFCVPDCTNGETPRGNMIQARDGNLYGTTETGGIGILDAGTIFKLTTRGTLTTVHTFCQLSNCTDGANPLGSDTLIQATDGNLYGVTRDGGAKGNGTIYQLSLDGTFKTIYKFCKSGTCTDGRLPDGLVQGLDGDFYGVTIAGGTNGDGVVFKVTKFGGLTVLYNFCSQTNCADGEAPSSLILGSDGNFYGTTVNDGSGSIVPDNVFQITPAGAYTVLHSTDLDTQQGVLSLMQATDGNFYGTYSIGGASNLGTLFRLSTGLGPFVRALRPYGAIGKTAYIMGTGLTGSTSVSFNGTPATTFTIVSDSEITAVIPTGATTGSLQVATPGGTLSSTVEFQVFQ
jgi:uncharacterized repeat protein (TIGR03803 family)